MKIKFMIGELINKIKGRKNGKLGIEGVYIDKFKINMVPLSDYLQREIDSNKISEKLIKKWLTEEMFWRWGFCGCDLSKQDLSGLSAETLRKLTFNSSTIWPEKDKMPKGFNPEKIIEEAKSPMLNFRQLHEIGIDGSGVEVAYIDSQLENPNHIELKGINVECCNLSHGPHFHGDCVLANLCGETVGVAPKVKVNYYGTDNGGPIKNIHAQIIKSLQNIVKKIENGANIKVVGRSGQIYFSHAKYDGAPKDIKEIKELVCLLDRMGCKVIDSGESNNNFFPGHFSFDDDKTDSNCIKKASWLRNDEREENFFKQKVVLICGGKVVPDFRTQNGYKYEQIDCASWTIPQVVGTYALCLQVNPNLTYEQFVDVCKENCDKTKKGYSILNPVETVRAASKLKMISNQK